MEYLEDPCEICGVDLNCAGTHWHCWYCNELCSCQGHWMCMTELIQNGKCLSPPVIPFGG